MNTKTYNRLSNADIKLYGIKGNSQCNNLGKRTTDPPRAWLNQILKPILMALIFMLSANTFSQNFSQGYLYVQIEDPIALPTGNGVYSSSTELNQMFDDHDVVKYSQSFPEAINEELQVTYELHFNGDLSEFYNQLTSTSFFTRVDSSDYYKAACNNPKQISETFPSPLNDDHLHLSDVYCAWSVTEGSENVTIGVVDTYFETDHEDMNGQITSVTGTSGDPACHYHGVAVTGVAAANVDNGIGIAGIGYNTKVRGYAFETYLPGCAGNPWEAIWQAYQDGCDIINVSFAGIGSYPQIAAVQEIVDNGTILVLAAGNGDAVPGRPYHQNYADIPGIINVSGVTASNLYAPTGHANNQYVDVAAMSTNVATTDINDSYLVGNGTSLAAPQVSGVAALILSVNPCLEPSEVEYIIKSTAVHIDDDYQYSYGFGTVNAYEAVLKAMTYPQSHAPITSNTTWDTEKHVSGELIIDPGATLTITGNVRLDQNAKIIVKPGARLVIDGGHLIANPDCGNFYWRGIEVQGNPSESQRTKTSNGMYEFQGEVVVINGGTIEDAKVGVSFRTETGDKEGGGILTANDANFVNNVISIEMNPYTHVHEYPNGNTVGLGDLTRIEHSTFKTTDGFMLDAENVRHVKIIGVNAIKMKGNTFVNENSTLGTSGHGDKGIAIEATNATFLLVDKYYPGGSPGGKHKNTFNNLLYGVRSSGFSDAGNIRIRGNEFTDVYRSIYLNNSKSATVMHNTMVIPEFDQNMFPSTNWPDNAPYGIYIDGCQGFRIEENELKEIYPYSGSYGIIVNNTGAYNHEIYKNTFEYLHVAMQAQNINRGTASSSTSSPDVGLKFICNDASSNLYWDIKVVGQSDNPSGTQGIGIARAQAVSVFEDGEIVDYPVGNIFSTGGSTAFSYDFHNDDAEQLYYRYYEHATDKEEPADYINITPVGNDDPHTCPSKIWQELTIDDFYTQLGVAQVALNSSRLILSIWKNGGLENLDEEVETTASWEVYEQFNSLMAESPYLCEDVIIAVIENPSFTDLMVKLLMIANPHVIESDEVMDALYDREPPMPESYIDQILAEEGTISQLTLLRADVAADYHLVRNIGQHIKRNYRRDTVNDYALDSLINFVSRQEELTDRYELAGIYLRNDMFDEMYNCLDDIPTQLELSDQEYDDHQNYLELYAIAENLGEEGSFIDQLDSEEISLLNTIAYLNRPGISQMAVAMLKANNPNEFFWHEVILDPDPEGEKSAENYQPDETKQDKVSGEALTIYPNPAYSFVTVAYMVEENTYKQLSVVVHGSGGNKVIDQNLPGYTNEVIIDLTKLSSGIYTVSLMGDGQRIATKKLNLLD